MCTLYRVHRSSLSIAYIGCTVVRGQGGIKKGTRVRASDSLAIHREDVETYTLIAEERGTIHVDSRGAWRNKRGEINVDSRGTPCDSIPDLA